MGLLDNEGYRKRVRKKIAKLTTGNPQQVSYYHSGSIMKQLQADIECWYEAGYEVVTQTPKTLLGSVQGTMLVLKRSGESSH